MKLLGPAWRGLMASLLVSGAIVDGAELPKEVKSAACTKPPTIDAVMGPDEWAEATTLEFDLAMLKIKTSSLSTRTCQIWVMNSANALYVAARIPDQAINRSLSPLDLDFASLAFCRGDNVAAGDDRKVIAAGKYLDKHVTEPGKDADDAHQDGKGAMQFDDGGRTYFLEWALPLDSGDKEDLQTQPGASVRFNLAYVDAFQADLRDTDMGSAYRGGLDSATEWGALKLAADVKDDGGAAFRGPEWLAKQLRVLKEIPAARLRVTETATVPAIGHSVAKAMLEFDYRDPHGKQVKGLAKLFVPASLEHHPGKFPLYHNVGYELDDAAAAMHVSRGFVVMTSRGLEANPLVRTVNPDIALHHIARSLPFVNDEKVIVAGGSAGGYITLMLASETFPLAGAAPDVPPINWGYNTAYFLQRSKATAKGTVATPVYDIIVPIAQQSAAVFGEDTGSETYYRNSPLSQLSTITCPVSVYWSTADMLVPIDQVGTTWVHPIDAAKFPPQFTFDPSRLTATTFGQQRLTDVLPADNYQLFVIDEQKIKSHLQPPRPGELPASETHQWSITILDEGAPEATFGHTKHAVAWSQRQFLERVLTQPIAEEQLTAVKLERLMDRYAGKEWLPTPLVHLDDGSSEQFDVLRGLRTYLNVSPDYAARFLELYGKLPSEKQVLPAEFLQQARQPKAANGQ